MSRHESNVANCSASNHVKKKKCGSEKNHPHSGIEYETSGRVGREKHLPFKIWDRKTRDSREIPQKVHTYAPTFGSDSFDGESWQQEFDHVTRVLSIRSAKFEIQII